MNKNLKATKQTNTGLNVEFENINSGRKFTLEHILNQIESGNSTYDNYHVARRGDTTYVRSNPDSKKKNNLE